MRQFEHSFDPPSGTSLGSTIDLTVDEIEAAAARELVQTPGAGLTCWKMLDVLLEPGSDFRFSEPLGQAREVKTAMSGLFGRFIARAYATRYLNYSHFMHLQKMPMKLFGSKKGQIRRVPKTRGDLPDWAAWGGSAGLAIIEAKGSHAPKGPLAARDRGFAQAERAEITIRGNLATFKRYAIATRWGVRTPLKTNSMLAVKDPEIDGHDVSPEEHQELGLGIVRHHYATLLGPLGHPLLAASLSELATTSFKNRHATAMEAAKSAVNNTPTRQIHTKSDSTSRDLIGGFITRAGPLDGDLAADQLNMLAEFKLRPAFIGVEREMLNAAIDGDIAKLTSRREKYQPDQAPSRGQEDGSGSWVIKIAAGDSIEVSQ